MATLVAALAFRAKAWRRLCGIAECASLRATVVERMSTMRVAELRRLAAAVNKSEG